MAISLSRRSFDDISIFDDLSGLNRRRFTQIGRGPFLGEFTITLIRSISIIAGRLNREVVGCVRSKQPSITIMTPLAGVPPSWVNGRAVRHGDLIFHWGEDDKVSRLGEGFTYQAIELPAQEAPENSALKDPSFHSCSNGAFLAKGPDIVLELGQYVSAAGAMADPADPLFCPESFSDAFSAHCWGVIERFCWREQGRSEYLTLPHRVRIFKAAKDLIHREEPPLNVSELARGVGVSERTLSHCFRTTVGQSPRTFLRAYRLNKTRDYIIRRADEEENVVTAAAMRYGFWHLGRFSAYYRTQFGEYPSATAEAHSGRPAAERSCRGDGQGMPPRMPERLIYT